MIFKINESTFKAFFLLFVYVYVCVCVSVYVWHMYAGTFGRSQFPQLDLQALVSHLAWVLGTELVFSERATSTANHCLISSAPWQKSAHGEGLGLSSSSSKPLMSPWDYDFLDFT